MEDGGWRMEDGVFGVIFFEVYVLLLLMNSSANVIGLFEIIIYLL